MYERQEKPYNVQLAPKHLFIYIYVFTIKLL